MQEILKDIDPLLFYNQTVHHNSQMIKQNVPGGYDFSTLYIYYPSK